MQENETTVRKEIVSIQDVQAYMGESTDVHDWNRRRDSLRRIYKGEKTLSDVFAAIDGSGLIVKVLG
jgi:hypothetical protein